MYEHVFQVYMQCIYKASEASNCIDLYTLYVHVQTVYIQVLNMHMQCIYMYLLNQSYCKQGFGVNRGLQNREMSPLLSWRMGMGAVPVQKMVTLWMQGLML